MVSYLCIAPTLFISPFSSPQVPSPYSRICCCVTHCWFLPEQSIIWPSVWSYQLELCGFSIGILMWQWLSPLESLSCQQFIIEEKLPLTPPQVMIGCWQAQWRQLALAVRSVFAVALSYSQGCFMRPSFPPSSSYLVFTEPSRDEIEMSCFGLSIKPSLLSYPEQPRICM